MKKTATILVLILLAISSVLLVGCGGKNTTKTTTSSNTTTSPKTTAPLEPGSSSDLNDKLLVAAGWKSKGDVKEVQKLLDQGADVNAANPSGTTPLLSAAMSGSPEVAELLINRGANVNARDVGGSIALGQAISMKEV